MGTTFRRVFLSIGFFASFFCFRLQGSNCYSDLGEKNFSLGGVDGWYVVLALFSGAVASGIVCNKEEVLNFFLKKFKKIGFDYTSDSMVSKNFSEDLQMAIFDFFQNENISNEDKVVSVAVKGLLDIEGRFIRNPYKNRASFTFMLLQADDVYKDFCISKNNKEKLSRVKCRKCETLLEIITKGKKYVEDFSFVEMLQRKYTKEQFERNEA